MLTAMRTAVIRDRVLGLADAIRAALRQPARADRARWRACASYTDVAALTAAWLRGEISTQPGYNGPVDVDERDVTGLGELLARWNELGFLTRQSQAGYVGPGADGGSWAARAAVQGLATPAAAAALQEIADAVPGIRLEVCVPPTLTGEVAVPVTWRAVTVTTNFGDRTSAGDLADEHRGYGICRRSAVDEICAAMQVVIYDVMPGRNGALWPALAERVGLTAWVVDLGGNGHEVTLTP